MSKRKSCSLGELSSEENEGDPLFKIPPLKQRKLNGYKFVSSDEDDDEDDELNDEDEAEQKHNEESPSLDLTNIEPMKQETEQVDCTSEIESKNDTEDVSMTADSDSELAVDYRIRKTDVYSRLHYCERVAFRNRVRAIVSSQIICSLEESGSRVDVAVVELISLFSALRRILECERCPASKIVHRCGLSDTHPSLCSSLTPMAKKKLSKAERTAFTDFNRYRRQLKAVNENFWYSDTPKVKFNESVSEIRRKLMLRKALFLQSHGHDYPKIANKFIPNLMKNAEWLVKEKIMDDCIDNTRFVKIKSSSMIVCSDCLTVSDGSHTSIYT